MTVPSDEARAESRDGRGFTFRAPASAGVAPGDMVVISPSEGVRILGQVVDVVEPVGEGELTGFGVVVRPRDAQAIRAGLAQLRDSPLDRAAGAQRARELYALDTVLDAYSEVFDRARAARRG